MSEKKRKKSDYNKDDAIRDVGPIYTDSKGNKSQIPSQEMFNKMHPKEDAIPPKGFFGNTQEPTYYDPQRDRDRIESVLSDVDQLGNVIPSTDITKPYVSGGRSPEAYGALKQNPYQRGSYKTGGDIHIEKGESYIKDLIK